MFTRIFVLLILRVLCVNEYVSHVSLLDNLKSREARASKKSLTLQLIVVQLLRKTPRAMQNKYDAFEVHRGYGGRCFR